MPLTIALGTAAFCWIVFLFWYTARAKWWKKIVGINTFLVSFAFTVVLIRAFVIRVWPGHVLHDISGTIVYTMAAALAIQRIVFVERSQRSIPFRGRKRAQND